MTTSNEEYISQAEPFIQRLARSFEQRGLVGEHKAVTKDDLIQVGRVATWRASQKYDPARGAKFFTFAFPAIWQAITAEVHRMSDTVKLPAAMHWEVIRHVAAAAEEMTNQLGGYPTLSELQENETLVKFLKSTKDIKEYSKVKELIKEAWIYLHGNREISLDTEEEERDLGELENTPGNFDLEKSVEERAIGDNIDAVMVEVLNSTERQVLRLRLGFEDGKGHTFRETADLLYLSAEGVRQIELAALEKLRKHPKSRALRRIGA